MVMPSEKRDQINTTANIIQTILLGLIIPVIAWLAISDKVQGEAIAVLKHEADKGDRYTRDMAERDLAPLVERANDHELRIRSLESHQ
jgi:hypothetical protein